MLSISGLPMRRYSRWLHRRTHTMTDYVPAPVASNYVPRRLGLCWSRVPGLLPVSAPSPSMDHEHETVCQPILEHQIRPSAPSSVISRSRPTCFSSSLRCCWQMGSAHRSSGAVVTVQRVRRRLQMFKLTYLLTYLPSGRNTLQQNVCSTRDPRSASHW